jgi:hypothetical protein
MNEDPTYKELCDESPELESAGKDLVQQVWAMTPNSKCFGMTPVEAFQLCAEAFAKMKEQQQLEKPIKVSDIIEDIGSASARIARPSRMSKVKNEPPMGRRAAIEHTKRKIEDGEN